MKTLVATLTSIDVRSPGRVRWATFLILAISLVAACFAPSVVLPSGAYTASLAVFAGPSAVLGAVLWTHGAPASTWGALTRAWLVLVPMGVVLNLAFADDFFVYPNASAVTGWSVSALDWSGPDVAHPIPIEEFAFYGLGFLVMLLLYALADAWLVPIRQAACDDGRGWLAAGGLLEAVLAPSGLVGSAWLLSDSGAPTYWTFLCAVPLPVTLWLWPLVRTRLNLGALGVTLGLIVAVSIVWEAVLAVPRGWWGYRPEAIFGPRLLGLPLEAIVVWILAPITTAVLFEALRRREITR